MKLNYVLLPETYQPRPRPGYRRLPKKAYEAFTPMSRAGRRVSGKAKVKTAMDNDGKKEEERQYFKFIRKMNNKAARPTYESDKSTSVNATPVPVMTNDQDGSGYLSSRARQKRRMTNDDKSSTLKAMNERISKRARYNPIASSSRVKVEDVPRLRDSTDSVGTAVYNDNQQRFGGEQYHYHESPPNPNSVPSHPPFALHTVRDTNGPIFPDHAVPHPAQPLWLDAGHAHCFALHNDIVMRNYDHELEHVAIGCACAGMDDELMDVDPEFPNMIPDDELSLERLAMECAYAGLDEPMDLALDDTRGPIYDFTPLGQPIFDQPGFYLPPQQAAQFDPNVMLQQRIFQAQEHHYFVDQDQLLQPPMHAYPIDQQFLQGDFFMNQNFPPQPFFEANHYPVMEGHHQIAQRFNIDQQYAGVHIPLPPIVHEEPNDRGLVPYPPGHEEALNQVLVPHLVDEMAGHNREILYETVVEAGERGDVDNDRLFLGGEAGERDHAELFEELFGADEDEDDGNEEEELEIII